MLCSPQPSRLYPGVAACALGLLLALPAMAADGAAAADLGLDREVALRTSQAALGRKVGEHVLLNREGQPVSLASFRGKPLLVSFIYTGCFQVCPTTTRSLQETVEGLQKSVGPNQFNVVSIGFNQPADSPQALKAFATQYGIRQPNWEFLSPPGAIVPALAQDFGFVFQATPAGFDHVLQVSILDAEGRIVRQVYGDSLAPADLGEPLKMLLSGTPVESNDLVNQLLDRVRILCTVYDPKTGAYKVDYGLPIQIAGGVSFFVVMLIFFINEWRSGRKAARRKGGVRNA
ncbi:MAG: SCO family protein [Proteobacteria bacterium]|nr:SCO family protein [Pseudomonadota bacterium]